MRLAAQLRRRFLPAAPELLPTPQRSCVHPWMSRSVSWTLCHGEGAAIRQLSELLDCPRARTYAIELDDSRAETIRVALPEAKIPFLANFFGCRCSPNVDRGLKGGQFRGREGNQKWLPSELTLQW